MRTALLLLFTGLFLRALPAQECTALYTYLKKGTTLEYTGTDKKGKKTVILTQTVHDVTSSADTLIAQVESKITNEKGEVMSISTSPIKCYQGTIIMDMRSMVPQQSGQSNGADMQVELTSSDLIFPAKLTPGLTLPDSDMDMKMMMGGIQIMNTHYSMRNRKVEAEEKVTTPAGTFQCAKISYDLEYRLMGKRTSHCEYWFSKDAGMVKTISYDKKGELESKMELTKKG